MKFDDLKELGSEAAVKVSLLYCGSYYTVSEKKHLSLKNRKYHLVKGTGDFFSPGWPRISFAACIRIILRKYKCLTDIYNYILPTHTRAHGTPLLL